jgi:hypothetical protein
MAASNIRYVFRGHQDSLYSCKNLIQGFADPTSLSPVHTDVLKKFPPAVRDWLKAKELNSIEDFYTKGFTLADLPKEIGPVFTFTNALAAKGNIDEGCGIVTVGDSWENSHMCYYINRPDLFALRAFGLNMGNILVDEIGMPESRFNSYSPDAAAIKLWLPASVQPLVDAINTVATPAKPVYNAMYTMLNFACLLPHYTYIDVQGNANTYLYLPEGALQALPDPAQHCACTRQHFQDLLAIFAKPEIVSGPGIAAEFEARIVSGDRDEVKAPSPASDGATTGLVSPIGLSPRSMISGDEYDGKRRSVSPAEDGIQYNDGKARRISAAGTSDEVNVSQIDMTVDTES